MNRERQNALVMAAVLTVMVFIVCWNLALPSFTIRDSALFSMVAWSGGVAHPPGSPTWCLLATLFVHGLDFRDAAWGTNLFCGLLGALTCGGLYLLAWRVLPSVAPGVGPRARLAAALIPPLLLMQSPGWWMQCLTTEQYTLMTVLLVLLAHLALSARRTPGAGLVWWLSIGVLWGLATGNHLSQICLVVPIALACWRWSDGSVGRVTSLWLARCFVAGLGFSVGFLVYLWVPLRSAMDPLIDSGNVQTLDDIRWLIGRDQFTRRAWYEAPPGFAWEWIRSYALLRELGVAGVVLMLWGLVVAARRAWGLLSVIAAFVFPYAAGLMYGHLRQAGFGVGYVLHYGVVDWHVAIYTWLALLGGIGAAALGQVVYTHFGAPWLRGWLIGLPVLLGIGVLVSAVSESRFASTGMENYSAALLDPLPPDSVVVLSTDNIAFVGAYDWWLNRRRPDLTVAWGSPAISDDIARNREKWASDPILFRRNYFEEVIFDKQRNPLRVPLPTADQVTSATLISDFTQLGAGAVTYLLPRGFLYEVSASPISDEDLLAADADWWKSHAVRLPRPDTTRLYQERRAWSELWERRGIYFLARSQFEEAARNYAIACAWFPEEARLHYRLGESLHRLGNTEAAEGAYRESIRRSRWEVGPRFWLADIVARRGELAQALRLLEEEARLNPADDRIPPHLEALREIVRGR